MEIARSAAIAEREIKRHVSAYRSRRYCPFGSRERLRQIIAGGSNDPRRTAAPRAFASSATNKTPGQCPDLVGAFFNYAFAVAIWTAFFTRRAIC